MVFNAETGDNEALRDAADFLQTCYRDRSITINPIVDWTEADVWEFLHHYGCESNPLYQCGEHRIGCIGCPLSQQKNMRKDFVRYPKYRASYIRAFDRMLAARLESGLPNKQNWTCGEDVMKWWLGDNPDQLSLFDEEELTDIFWDMGQKYV